MNGLTIEKKALFAQLAQGHGAKIAVVTPNRRLARALTAGFDAHQSAKGLVRWETADILPLGAFVARAWSEAMHGPKGGTLAAPLTQAQALALWMQVIRHDSTDEVFLSPPEAAALAMDAWQIEHEWRLRETGGHGPLSDDAQAFREWAQRFGADCERLGAIDGARLADRVAALYRDGSAAPPAQLVCAGFDIVTPQMAGLLEAIAGTGCDVAQLAPLSGRAARIVRRPCADARAEVAEAAAWARSRLEADPGARIGIVVPELASRRASLGRALAAAMEPGRLWPSATPRPFNFSLGEPLAGHALVADALAVLTLCGPRIAFKEASRLLRSPFIAAAEREIAARARLDAWMRDRVARHVTIDQLVALALHPEAPGCPALRESLAQLAKLRRERLFEVQRPSGWARAFGDALLTAGFPGERGLDSAEHQALAKLHELFTEIASLDRVSGKLRFTDALSRLARLASATLFQPETPDVPVQVLGVLEAAQLEFDHLWVMGLAEEVWPSPPRPNPLLPIERQRAAGIPQASAEASLEFCRRIALGWKHATGELVVSHPLREGDRELLASPLIAGIEAAEAEAGSPETWGAMIHASAAREAFEDAAAPALVNDAALHGGTQVLRDQALCPFRAFARQRLRAEAPELPHDGLDAMERGTLVHAVLAKAWKEAGTKAAMDALGEAGREALLSSVAEEAVKRKQRDRADLSGRRFGVLEQARLVRVATEWIAYELAARGDFTVEAVEDKRLLAVGPLSLRTRLDRVDALPDGSRIVIDYKSTAPGAGAWLPPRPEEPQLPLYLVAGETNAVAIAFAQVKAGEAKFVALARDKDMLPGAKVPKGEEGATPEALWQSQVANWKRELERLAGDFVAGDARVDPKQPGKTCNGCDLHALCRIHERTALYEEEGENGSEA
jgi:probable DNA repair protein